MKISVIIYSSKNKSELIKSIFFDFSEIFFGSFFVFMNFTYTAPQLTTKNF